MKDENNNSINQAIKTPETSIDLNDSSKINEEITHSNRTLTMEYLLEKIDKIATQTEYLNNAIEQLGKMDDGVTGEAYSHGNTDVNKP